MPLERHAYLRTYATHALREACVLKNIRDACALREACVLKNIRDTCALKEAEHGGWSNARIGACARICSHRRMCEVYAAN